MTQKPLIKDEFFPFYKIKIMVFRMIIDVFLLNYASQIPNIITLQDVKITVMTQKPLIRDEFF